MKLRNLGVSVAVRRSLAAANAGLRPVVQGAALALGGLAVVAADAQENLALEELVVTGTRIRTPGLESSSPIASISAETLNSTLPINVEEVMRTVPGLQPAIGQFTNNGSNGFATVDLRGLGTNRNLVLINGRRVVPATLGGSVDTNVIPIGLLERVDVVTGGASTVYGSDAITGVLNFITVKNFNGIEISGSYGESEQGDSARQRTDLILGADLADGRGNVVLSVGYTKTDPLKQGERDFGFFSINSRNGAAQGSATGVPMIIDGLGAALPGERTVDPTTGLLIPTVPSRDYYNFNPVNYYITPLERTQITALGSYSINDYAEAYAEVFHTKGTVTLNLAESGTFQNTLFIPIGNPYIPNGIRNQLCTAFGIAAANCVPGNPQEVRFSFARRFVELGPRINEFDNTTTQYTVGVRGDLPFENWSYDVYYQDGSSEQVSNRINWGSRSKLQQALRAVNTTTCIDPSNRCVPINLWGPAGSITPEMLNFINLNSLTTTFVDQTILNGSVNGDLGAFKSPWAESPIGLALGVEVRELEAGNQSDGSAQIQGEVLGTGAPTPDRRGSVDLNEAFVEFIAPLLEEKTGFHYLALEAGYRYTEFETEVSKKDYDTFKYGLSWAPIEGLRFRVMEQRATRAPSINELYAPVVTGLSNRTVDPCQLNLINTAQAGTPGTLSYLCAQTGVPASQIGFVPAPSAGQIRNTSGGNPLLGPEEADTLTIGLVWQPTFIPRLSVSIDYVEIEVSDAVSSPTANQVIDGCYSASLNPTLSPNAPFCRLVGRDPTTGGLSGNDALGAITQVSNLGKYWVEGFDVQADYSLPLENLGADPKWGRLDFSLSASTLERWDFKSLPTVATIDCKGLYGLNCGNPFPELTFNQRTTWRWGDYSLGYNWRYIDGTKVEPITGTWFPAYSKIDSFHYFDLNAGWQATENINLSLAVRNLTDESPPEVGNTIGGTGPNSGNTFPQMYDVVGRAYSLQMRVKF